VVTGGETRHLHHVTHKYDAFYARFSLQIGFIWAQFVRVRFNTRHT
jgi:hypothetical protein